MNGRILITGSNGLLGQKIIAQLIREAEFDFHATSSGANRITTVDFQYTSVDITDPEQVDGELARTAAC